MIELARPRLLIQYLEPSPAVDAIDPNATRDHLSTTLERLPVSDLALGWRLRPEVIEAVRAVVPAGVTVWRWVPVFVDSGKARTVDRLVAVGPDGTAPSPFEDMADFRFLCLDTDEVVEAGLERAVALGREIGADGVLLDRIRWHSPSHSPALELTCFCPESRAAASADGLELQVVGKAIMDAGATLDGRRTLVSILLGGTTHGPIADFIRWRSQRVTRAIERLVDGLRVAGFRAALDVFTPALARSVGQDLASIGSLGEWSKSMTYFEAVGPASMPYELAGYARWLEDAGEPDAAAFLADILGFDAPGVGGSGAQLEGLSCQARALVDAMGSDRAVVGLDAVEIAGVCEVAEGDLVARVTALRGQGVGMSPCWELLFIGEERQVRIASAWV